MRAIAPGEHCISATDIVVRFEQQTGHALHATNAGKAAKELDLDYIEVEVEANPATPWVTTERRYAVLDLPLIFGKLQALADRRAKYPNPT